MGRKGNSGNGKAKRGWEKAKEWKPLPMPIHFKLASMPDDRSLTRTEEQRLFKQIAQKHGDVNAAEKRVILANLKLVVMLAKKYARSPKQLLSLIEDGNVALIRALERYDYRKDCRFNTYAAWWISRSIKGRAE